MDSLLVRDMSAVFCVGGKGSVTRASNWAVDENVRSTSRRNQESERESLETGQGMRASAQRRGARRRLYPGRVC